MDVLCLGTLWSNQECEFIAIFGSRRIRSTRDASQLPAGHSARHEVLNLLLQAVTSAGISPGAHKPEILTDAFARQ